MKREETPHNHKQKTTDPNWRDHIDWHNVAALIMAQACLAGFFGALFGIVVNSNQTAIISSITMFIFAIAVSAAFTWWTRPTIELEDCEVSALNHNQKPQ